MNLGELKEDIKNHPHETLKEMGTVFGGSNVTRIYKIGQLDIISKKASYARNRMNNSVESPPNAQDITEYARSDKGIAHERIINIARICCRKLWHHFPSTIVQISSGRKVHAPTSRAEI
jgi:hypothetical protein